MLSEAKHLVDEILRYAQDDAGGASCPTFHAVTSPTFSAARQRSPHSLFTNAQKALVTAGPTFESVAQHARSVGAQVIRVPLDAGYAHDVAKMLEAARGAGLVYVCNPNNPTATITPDKSLRSFLTSLPATRASWTSP